MIVEVEGLGNLEFPDDTPEDVINATVKRELGLTEAPSGDVPSEGGYVTGLAKDIGKSALQGAVGDNLRFLIAGQEIRNVEQEMRMSKNITSPYYKRPVSARTKAMMKSWYEAQNAMGRPIDDEAWVQEATRVEEEQRQERVASMQGLVDQLPMPSEREDFFGKAMVGATRFLSSMAVSYANPVAGTVMVFTQIAGLSYDEYRKAGVSSNRAWDAALINALLQTPIEQAGNLFQIGFLKHLGRHFIKGGVTTKRATDFIEMLGKSALAEGLEEGLQTFPEEIAHTYAANPDKKTGDIVKEIMGNWKHIVATKGKDAFLLGATGGAGLMGMAGAIQSPFNIGSYMSEAKLQSNMNRVAKELPENIKQAVDAGLITREEAQEVKENAEAVLPPIIGEKKAAKAVESVQKVIDEAAAAPEEVTPVEGLPEGVPVTEEEIAEGITPEPGAAEKVVKELAPKTKAVKEAAKKKGIPVKDVKAEKVEPEEMKGVPKVEEEIDVELVRENATKFEQSLEVEKAKNIWEDAQQDAAERVPEGLEGDQKEAWILREALIQSRSEMQAQDVSPKEPVSPPAVKAPTVKIPEVLERKEEPLGPPAEVKFGEGEVEGFRADDMKKLEFIKHIKEKYGKTHPEAKAIADAFYKEGASAEKIAARLAKPVEKAPTVKEEPDAVRLAKKTLKALGTEIGDAEIDVVYKEGMAATEIVSKLTGLSAEEQVTKTTEAVKKERAEYSAKMKEYKKLQDAQLERNLKKAKDAGGVRMQSPESKIEYLIAPSTREEGKWQATWTDEKGVGGHSTFSSLENAIKSVTGFSVEGPAIGDRRYTVVETTKPKKVEKVPETKKAKAAIEKLEETLVAAQPLSGAALEEAEVTTPEAKAEKRKPGKVRLDKGGVKYFYDTREIKRGKSKGKVEVTLTTGKKVLVWPKAIREWPEGVEAVKETKEAKAEKAATKAKRTTPKKDAPERMEMRTEYDRLGSIQDETWEKMTNLKRKIEKAKYGSKNYQKMKGQMDRLRTEDQALSRKREPMRKRLYLAALEDAVESPKDEAQRIAAMEARDMELVKANVIDVNTKLTDKRADQLTAIIKEEILKTDFTEALGFKTVPAKDAQKAARNLMLDMMANPLSDTYGLDEGIPREVQRIYYQAKINKIRAQVEELPLSHMDENIINQRLKDPSIWDLDKLDAILAEAKKRSKAWIKEKQEAQKKKKAEEVQKELEQKARYHPVPEGKQKRPTMAAMGMGKRDAGSWFTFTALGKKAWSNGHMMDLSAPPYPQKQYEANLGDHRNIHFDEQINKSKQKAVRDLPAPYAMHDIAELKEQQYLYNIDGETMAINKKYIDYFNAKYDNPIFKFQDTDRPIVVYEGVGSKQELVAIVMPMRPGSVLDVDQTKQVFAERVEETQFAFDEAWQQEINRANAEELRKRVLNSLMQVNAPQSVLDRFDIAFPEKISIEGVDPEVYQKSLKSWAEKKGMTVPEFIEYLETSGKAIFGAADILTSGNALMRLAQNFPNFAQFDRTTLHEYWHIAEKFLLPFDVQQSIIAEMPDAEQRAKAFAAFAEGKEFEVTAPTAMQSAFRYLKEFFQKLNSAISGMGFKRQQSMQETMEKMATGFYTEVVVPPGQVPAHMIPTTLYPGTKAGTPGNLYLETETRRYEAHEKEIKNFSKLMNRMGVQDRVVKAGVVGEPSMRTALDMGNAFAMTNKQMHNVKGLAKYIRTMLRKVNAPQEVIDRIEIDIVPWVNLNVEAARESLEAWARRGYDISNPDLLMIPGATTFLPTGHAVIELSMYHENLEGLERTALHEYYEIAREWLLPKKDLDVLNRHFKNKEIEADAFVELAKTRLAQTDLPGPVRRVLLRLRRYLQMVRSWVNGRGFTRPNDIFGELLTGHYTPHFAGGTSQQLSLDIAGVLKRAIPTKLPAREFVPMEGAHVMTDPTREKQWQDAAAYTGPGFWERSKEGITAMWHRATREHEHLPKTGEFGEIRAALSRLAKQKGVVTPKAFQEIEEITRNMTPVDAHNFTRLIVFKDFKEEAKLLKQKGMPVKLPGGMTEAELDTELKDVQSIVRGNTVINEALKKRAEVWDSLRREYSLAMKKVGLNVEERLKRKDYFRHVVLDYIQSAGLYGTGAELKVPRGRSHLKSRSGVENMIMVNYAKVEHEILAQMMYDIEVANTIDRIERRYNAIAQFKLQANNTNYGNVMGVLNALAAQMSTATEEVTGEQLYRKLGKKTAIGYSMLGKMAAAGELDAGPGNKWQPLINALAANWSANRNKKAEDRVALDPQYADQVLSYANWILKEKTPGRGAAATIFKGIREKKQAIADLLGDRFVTWEKLVKESPDYTVWQADRGNIFYNVYTIPEQIAEDLMTGALSSFGMTKGDIRRVLAIGGKRKQMVVKNEVAATLENLAKPVGGWKPSKKLLKMWKQWQLLMPRRLIKYNFRNLTGDADAMFAGNARSFKKVPQATKELMSMWAYSSPAYKKLSDSQRARFEKIFGKPSEPSQDMRDWMERGGYQTLLQAQEMDDFSDVLMFGENFLKAGNQPFHKAPLKAVKKYWAVVRRATDTREAILRYANYLDYMESMRQHPEGRPHNFGASVPDEIMGMQSIKDRAFFLSNDLLGAYDRVSVWGQNVRERYIPFWSWKEVNMRRYLQIMKNAFNDKGIWQGVGKNLVRSAAIKSPYYIVRGGSLALSLTMFQIMIAMWNSWAFGDEEDDLPEDIRKRTHILLPSLDALARGEWTSKDSEGKTQYFSRVGALADLLEWFGLDAAKQDAQDLMTGRMPIEEKLKDFYRSPINVVVQGLHPAWKVGGELAMRQAMFPEWHKPRVIRDRVLHTMRSIGLENEYIAFMDTFVRPTPSRGYLKSVKNVFVYESDPFEAAYYDTYANKRRFQKKMGKFGEGYWLTPKGSALYSARTALRYGDEDAMVYYMNEYFKMGGTKKGLLRSLDNLNPLAGIAKKDRAAFVASLSPEDLDKLVKAMVFYVQLRTGHKASELFKLIDEEKDRRKPKPIRPPFESIGKLGEIAKIKPLTKREAKGGK